MGCGLPPIHLTSILIENKAVQSKQNIGAELGKSKGSNICLAAVSERLVAISRNLLRINYSDVALCFSLFCFIPFLSYTLMWGFYFLLWNNIVRASACKNQYTPMSQRFDPILSNTTIWAQGCLGRYEAPPTAGGGRTTPLMEGFSSLVLESWLQ